MFNYPYQKDQIVTPTKALFLGLLCTIWLLTGLIGHDPWKPDEAYSFGLVYHIIQSGEWLVPTLAGDVFIEKPPLFYWTAAVFAKVFAPILPLHDGARLASGFYMALTLLFTALTGREFFGRSAGWTSVIVFIGSLGILTRAHLLVTDLALLTGCAMMIYGYALSARRHFLAGFLLGTGVGIGFLAKGFIAPVFFILISAGLLLIPAWRTRNFYSTLGSALLSLLPWLTIWPTLLFLRSPDLFIEWAWQLNIQKWLDYARGGSYPDVFYYLTMLPWYAWPALPLAIWSVWEARRKISRSIEFQLMLVTFGVMLLVLSLAPRINDLCGMPLLLPLTLLATGALFTLRRGAANALDWFSIMTFALLAILLWWGWTGLLVDSPAKITHLLKDYRPGFEPIFQRNPFIIAVTVSVLWVVLVWRVGRSIRRSVINWAAGATLLWILGATIWMPWLNSSKSYRVVMQSLKQSLPEKYLCMSGQGVGVSERAMLQYYAGITLRAKPRPECDLLLLEGRRLSQFNQDLTGWKKLWEGGRQGDQSERFWLFKRKDSSVSQ